MKSITIIVSTIVVGLFVSPPLLSYANNDAPVEDLSVENAQSPAGDMPVNDTDAESSQPADMGQAQANNPPQQVSRVEPNGTNSASNGNDNALENVGTGMGDKRLKQQVTNIISMNMPQQIAELRQEVQQLNGQLQMQKHDIKVLEDQQRSFYQDLNHRIQQVRNPGVTPVIQQTKKSMTLSPSTPVSQESQDSTVYRSAFNLLVKKKYDDALNAFRVYTSQYPHGNFIANAYYWMGELYLKKNDTEMAVQSLERIVSQYPSSNKLPDAKLKLAIIHASQGKPVQAKQELRSIKVNYPNSTAAQLATIQLQRMEQ